MVPNSASSIILDVPEPKAAPRRAVARAKAPEQEDLAKALRDLQETIIQVPQHYSHLTNPGKHLIFTYVKGIVYGLGALTAVAIIIPLMVALLRQVPWGPIVGDFMQGVVERMQQRP